MKTLGDFTKNFAVAFPEEIFKKLPSLLSYFIAAILSIIVLFISSNLINFNFHYPLVYSGDALFSATVIKTIIETGWNNYNPNLGLPFEYNMANFPAADGFHYLIIKFLALFSHDYAIIINSFFILSFPLATISALFVMKQIGLRFPLALVASILFAMAPYHFNRNINHLFLSSYFTIPLCTWLAILIKENKIFTQTQYKWTCPLFCILIGSSGVYYAYFSIFLILLAGLATTMEQKKIKAITPSLFVASLISITLIINITPTLVFRIQHPESVDMTHRNSSDAEVYGLKITSMLLPTNQFINNNLSNLAQKYSKHSALPYSEGEAMELGLFASIGFIILIILLVQKDILLNNRIKDLCLFNLFSTLLGTMGGLGSIVAYTVFAEIRSYNRISIFILFFSITTFFYIVQSILNKFIYVKTQYLTVFVASLLLITGVYTQRSTIYGRITEWGISEIESDKAFVTQLEKTLPGGSPVFQLPYMSFPESPPLNGMASYFHFKPYLYSHNLKWSFGSLKNAKGDLWQRTISSLPTPFLLQNLAYANFSGLYIDRRGYLDQAKGLESELNQILHTKPIQSKNENLIFFNLIEYSHNLERQEGNQLWHLHQQAAKDFNPILPEIPAQ